MTRITDTVSLDIEDGIAFVTIDNPPVNALGQSVREGISRAVEQAGADDAVEAVVLIAEGRTFPAGADITEFGKPPKEPFLPDVCRTIEDCPKLVIAAMHGTALGGGFELALAAHYRIALEGSRVGLPEVNLGLLPGAGGTQRLPRLTGAKWALKLMLSGKPVDAREAQRAGAIDEVVPAKLRSEAARYARRLMRGGWGPRPTRERREGISDPTLYSLAVDAARAETRKKARGQLAPFMILDCVEAARKLPFDEGMAKERACFLKALESDESKGMIHAFFAERRAARFPEAGRAEARPLAEVGVIGGGTMGAGIATAALKADLPVVLVERDDEAARAAHERIAATLSRDVEKGRRSADWRDAALARLTTATEMAALSDCDLVIEAVFEDMAVKKQVFAELDRVAKEGAVLATNTSYLDIAEIAAATGRPGDVLGLHFFSPAHVMRLLEIVVAETTSDAAVATGLSLAKRLGKVPVRAGVCDGFIGNRLLAAYRKAAEYMVEDGASPYQVDRALQDFGFAMGPFRMMDLAGGDIAWAGRKRRAATRPAAERYVEIADRLCERGWFGQKTGRGWYRYEEGNRQGQEDPEVLALIDAERAKKGITPRDFTDDEIVSRYMAAMVNEGCRILDEGIALRPSDIDVVLVHGYGFPRWRGGPMKWADMQGLAALRERLTALAGEDAHFWTPAPLLERLVAEGRSFDDLNRAAE